MQPSSLLAMAVPTVVDTRPEGVAGLRQLRGIAPAEKSAPPVGSVIVGISRAVVRWVTLATPDAGGVADLGAGLPMRPRGIWRA